VADITQQRTSEGWLYLAVVLDAFSRRIVGWSMAELLRTELVLDALDMAIAQRQPAAGLVHHTGHGWQYTSLGLGRRLQQAGLVASMGTVGDALDNAVAESSSPPSSASCSTATTGRPAKPYGPPCSTSSRSSTTASLG
jgi:putative transposase